MTVLHRLVESGGAYPPRPTVSVDFLGATDPGSLLLPGDTWTQLPAATESAPETPTIGTASAGDASAAVSFTPASSGPAVTGYTVTSTPGAITATGTASPITVSGLTNGTAYTFTVKATNSAGSSPESAVSNSVTPTGGGGGSGGVTDTFTGADGSAWSDTVWGTAPGSAFTNDVQGNQGRALFDSAGSYEEFTRKFALADAANWRVRWKLVAPPATAGWSNLVFIQATNWTAGANTPVDCYIMSSTSGGVKVRKRSGGVNADLTTQQSLSATDRWVDIKVVDGALFYKAWTGELADEPASYTPVTNTSPLTGAGAAGMFFGSSTTAGTMDFRIDDVLVDNDPS